MSEAVRAVIFDWAGTMVDFGSRAPVIALRRLFANARVPITEAEARKDMGIAKRDHIAALLATPRIADAWAVARGTPPKPDDIDFLFLSLGPLMREAARDSAQLIPGAAQVAATLRSRGVKLGSCTGYSRDMMTDILPLAAAQGYEPDCVVCAGETPAGRPSPLMVWKNLVELGVWPASTCVKVDDTETGIAEGLAAGVWTIGVAASGNIVGLSRDDLAALPAAQRQDLVQAARDRLTAAGAHHVIDTVADLLPLITGPLAELAPDAESRARR